MVKIAVIIPAYNSEKYIKKCFDSILCQTLNDAQVIVIDDHSSDNTPNIITEYSNHFAKAGMLFCHVRLDQNSGQAACFNYALSLVNAEYVMWLDSDDFLYPNCFEEKVRYMDKHFDIDLCICKANLFNYPDYSKVLGTLEKKHKENDYFLDILKMFDVVWPPGSICVKTSFLFERIPSKKIYNSRQGQNIQLLLPILYESKYEYIDYTLYGVVSHIDSHSRASRSFEEQLNREKELLVIYKKTLETMHLSHSVFVKCYIIAKKTINKHIFDISVYNKKFFHIIYYFFKIDCTSRKHFIKCFLLK